MENKGLGIFEEPQVSQVSICKRKKYSTVFTYYYNRGRVNSIAIHPTGKIALSVAIDRTAIVWNLMTGRKASVNKLGRG